MYLEVFPVLRDDGGIQKDGVEAAEELVVDLDPLDAEVVGDVRGRVRVLGRDAPERRVDELLHPLVDDRDADSLEAEAKGECCNDVDVDGFESALPAARDRVLARERVGGATLELEDALLLGIVGKAYSLCRSFGANVDRKDAALSVNLARGKVQGTTRGKT